MMRGVYSQRLREYHKKDPLIDQSRVWAVITWSLLGIMWIIFSSMLFKHEHKYFTWVIVWPKAMVTGLLVVTTWFAIGKIGGTVRHPALLILGGMLLSIFLTVLLIFILAWGLMGAFFLGGLGW